MRINNPWKVYVVTKGTYSDYRIEAIFDNKEAADNLAYNLCGQWDEARVEEYEVGKVCDRMLPRWCGLMDRYGNSEYPGKATSENSPYVRFYPERKDKYTGRDAYLSFSIETETLEKAIKIMNEKRILLIATGFWDNPIGGKEYYDLEVPYYEL